MPKSAQTYIKVCTWTQTKLHKWKCANTHKSVQKWAKACKSNRRPAKAHQSMRKRPKECESAPKHVKAHNDNFSPNSNLWWFFATLLQYLCWIFLPFLNLVTFLPPFLNILWQLYVTFFTLFLTTFTTLDILRWIVFLFCLLCRINFVSPFLGEGV